MALAFYFAPKIPMSGSKYDECIKQLIKAGAGHPRGRLYHAAFGTPESLAVFDVWTSQAEFDEFGHTLMPIMQQLGVDPGQPAVMPVRNVIVPPAAKPKAAAKKPAPKKRAAPKKQAKAKRSGKRR